MSEIIIKTDGGSRGNPGPAAIGVDMQMGEWTFSFGKCIGETTNNVAEYKAILTAAQNITNQEFQAKLPEPPKKVLFKLDSELVVKQLNGLYRVKDPNLGLLYSEVKQTLDKLIIQGIIYEIKHIRREENKIADKEVNIALDNQKNN